MKISQVLTGGGLLPGRVHHILTNGLLNSERQQPPTHQHQPPHPSQLSRQPKSSHVMENAPLVPVAQNFAEIGPTESPISKDDPIFWAKFKRVAGVEFFPRAAAVVGPRVRGAGRSSSTLLPCTIQHEKYEGKYKYINEGLIRNTNMICKYISCAAEIQCKWVGQNLGAAGICILTVAPEPVSTAGRGTMIPQSRETQTQRTQIQC